MTPQHIALYKIPKHEYKNLRAALSANTLTDIAYCVQIWNRYNVSSDKLCVMCPDSHQAIKTYLNPFLDEN